MQASCKAFHVYMNMYMSKNRLCSFTQVCCVVWWMVCKISLMSPAIISHFRGEKTHTHTHTHNTRTNRAAQITLNQLCMQSQPLHSSTENTLVEHSLRRRGKYLPWPLHLITLSLKHMRLSKPHQERHILTAIFYLDLLQEWNSF